MNIIDKLRNARTRLILDHPFYGNVACQFDLVRSKRPERITITGDRTLYINPRYVEEADESEIMGALAECVLHVALGHTWRGMGLEHAIWNEACGYVVREELRKSGLAVAKDQTTPVEFQEQPAEYVYGVLVHRPRNPDGGPSGGPGGGGNDPDQQPKPDQQQPKPDQKDQWKTVLACESEAEGTEAKESGQIFLRQLMAFGPDAGELPGFIQREIDRLLNPKVPWAVLLRDFLVRTANNDFTWTLPNRRYLRTGFFMPSLISDELPEVAVVIDTSSSIKDHDIKAFISEVNGILGSFDTRVRVVYCDTEVKGEQIFESQDFPVTADKFHPTGKGGTKFKPAFDYIETNDIQPSCMLYMTDLRGPMPDCPPPYPVLWMCSTDLVAPWGETIPYRPSENV